MSHSKLTIFAVQTVVVCVLCAITTSLAAQQKTGDQSLRADNSADRLYRLFIEECVPITPGTDAFPKTFTMGTKTPGRFSLAPKIVEMKQPFRICKYETTQELYEAVMGENPSRWKGPRNSVERMTIAQAREFCERLTMQLHQRKLLSSAEKVRLPTEAEWEYCCRAGTTTAYSFGDSATAQEDRDVQATILNDYAWHTGNAAGNDPVVGSLKPNPWGLYDMHGYLWEFVSDPYVPRTPVDSDAEPASSDDENIKAQNREKTFRQIVRGGSWRDSYPHHTCDSRMPVPELAVSDAIGIRCVISE